MKRLLHFAFVSLLTTTAFAQEKGFLRGNLGDGEFGGPLIGATVSVPSLSSVGTTTDFDGNFSLSLEPGTYSVLLSYISFESQTHDNIVIKAGEVTRLDAVMQMATQKVEMVTIKAKAKTSSEVGALLSMKNATVVSDGLSSQTFKKVGDSNLSGAIRRVTGVTVTDGNVFVRGLGDRYTKQLLNGMVLPGLDPDKNSVQVGIFPTAVVENVNVYKSFAPNLNGDFTGGLVDVVTKKFPEEKTTQITLGLGYTIGQTFNPDFILYTPGKTDFLGIDDGTRALGIDPEMDIPDESRVDEELESITRSFGSELAAKERMAFLNTSFSVNHGNQINKENGATFGYNVVFNYSNRNAFFEDFQANDFLKPTELSETELERQRIRIGVLGRNTVMWNALVTGSVKKGNNSYTLTALYNQSGESTATQRSNRDVEQNQSELVEDVLTYSQRTLGTIMLNGTHRVKNIDLKWGNAFSYSRVYDPDLRETRISITDGDTTLATGTGAGINRFWRDLTEFNESFKFDAKIPLRKNISISTGIINTYQTRTFEVHNYKHQTTNLSDVSIDPDWYLSDDNIWSADFGTDNFRNGTFTIGNFQLANQYEASQNVLGGYVMSEYSVAKKLNFIFGLRVEHAMMFYRGQNSDGSERYLNVNTLNEVSFLPALNIVFKATDKMNVRAGYSRTVARPSFKEKSIAEIYDPITKRTFTGNIDLNQTNIDNADIRYEYFMGGRDLIAVSGFYKHFDGHIELVAFPTEPDNMKPRNSGTAQVFGGEIELRKGLARHTSSKFLKGFFFAVNASIVHSMVDLNSVIVDNQGTTEFEIRENYLRDNESLSQFRPMSGQSPYAVNASLGYEIGEGRGNISLAYNVQGDQLTIIGSGRVPDVYTLSFHSLNFNAYVNLGKEKNSRITLGVMNLLDDDRTLVYRSHGAEDQFFTTFKPGRTIRLRYSYTF